MHPITWNGDLSLTSATQVRALLLEKAQTGASNTLTISTMSKLDIAGLQVLLSTRLWLENNGAHFNLSNNDQAHRVNSLCQAMGFDSFNLEGNKHA